jgi:type II protein arginine methyltransferase
MKHDSDIADRAFEPLVMAAKGNAKALLALAGKALARGDNQRSFELVHEAKALQPDNPSITAIGDDLLARAVPGWHIRMMKDAPRNAAFQDAINRAVSPESRVLDIGSGSGLLAMMAARAGAAVVHSCELNPAIAAVAKDIVQANGFADRITVHGKNSRHLDAEADLGGRADIIVSEIIGDDLVCEQVLPSLRDASRRLAKSNAIFIPQAGEIRVALACHANLDERNLHEICGFDISVFNRLQPARFSVKVGAPELEVRGEAASLFAFDFTTTGSQPDSIATELVATGGNVNGVIQWFRLQMDATSAFENGPGPDAKSSWGWNFFPFTNTVEAREGERIAIAATVTGDRLRLWKT